MTCIENPEVILDTAGAIIYCYLCLEETTTKWSSLHLVPLYSGSVTPRENVIGQADISTTDWLKFNQFIRLLLQQESLHGSLEINVSLRLWPMLVLFIVAKVSQHFRSVVSQRRRIGPFWTRSILIKIWLKGGFLAKFRPSVRLYIPWS